MVLADTYADLDGHLEGLYRGQLVAEEEVQRLCEQVKEVLQAESNVVPVRAPVTVVRPLARRREAHRAGAVRGGGARHVRCSPLRQGWLVCPVPRSSRLCPAPGNCAPPGG